ncbi:uncharacterized protein LOC143525834 [Brachyhypopomus gauderio]|uniref:uncharacterized protein LOC143525834 n=1 Tax=Brachyhypopomus gauderio TaxID=698409 RepID=UPI0040427D19
MRRRAPGQRHALCLLRLQCPVSQACPSAGLPQPAAAHRIPQTPSCWLRQWNWTLKLPLPLPWPPPQHSLPTAEPEQQPLEMQPVSTAEVLLPEGWKQTLPKEQHQWVSRALFTRDQSGRLALTKNLRLWWPPPGPRLVYT